MEDEDAIFEALLSDDLTDCDFGLPDGYEDIDDVGYVTASTNNQQYLAKCQKCNRTYKTLARYKTHQKMHKMSDAFCGVPSVDSLYCETPRMFSQVLDAMALQLPNIHHGLSLKTAILHLKSLGDDCEYFVKFQLTITDLLMSGLPAAKHSPRRGQTYPLPSEIRSTFCKSAASIIANPDALRESRKILEKILPGLDSIAMGKFMPMLVRRFSEKLLANIFESMKKAAAPTATIGIKRPPRTEKEVINFKQVVHYVGGSVIRRVLNRAFRNKSSEKWSDIVKCVRELFIIPNPALAGDDELKAWTQVQDRGGLLHLNDVSHELFYQLALIVEDLEASDGSLNFDSVLSQTYSGPFFVEWEDLIRSSLPREDSLLLLDMCVTFFCQTWGVGSKLKRVNLLSNKTAGTTKVSLRSGLTRQ